MKARILGLSLLTLSAAAAASAQTTLQYRWKQGEAVIYRTTLKTESTMSGMAGAADVSLSQTMTQRIKLLAVAIGPDGAATLHQTIEAVRVEVDTMMGKVAYDSEHPGSSVADDAAQALGRVFGGMVGATITVAFAPDGAIGRIDGVQKVYDRIAQDLPRDRSAAQMAQTLKSVLSEESIRAALGQSFPRLPAQPVKIGDTWTGQIALGSDATGRISGTQTMTLKRIEGGDAGVATIAVALALKQESSPPLGPAGMTMKLGDSKGAGEIEFDLGAGRIRKATMSTDMPSTMTAPGPDGRPTTLRNTTRTSMIMEEVR